MFQIKEFTTEAGHGRNTIEVRAIDEDADERELVIVVPTDRDLSVVRATMQLAITALDNKIRSMEVAK